MIRATRLFYTQALSVELVYRFALLQSFATTALGFIGLVAFWLAAGAASGPDAAYTPALLVAYFVTAGAVSLLQETQLSWNLSTSIRMGKLSAAMLRPYPYLIAAVSQAAAQVTVRFAILSPIVVLAFALVPGLSGVAAAFTPDRLAAFAAALALALATGWLIRLVVGLLAFDMVQTWGPEIVFLSLYAAGSGTGYPPDLLPAWIFEALGWTPVYYMVGFPTLVLLGKIQGAAVADGLLRGGLVAVFTFVLVVLMWRRGVRRFEAVGI